MTKTRSFILQCLEQILPWEKNFLPRGFLRAQFRTLCRFFEEEAIECYFSDHQDIGFFETFILGSDETKKISRDSNRTMSAMKKSEIMEKLSGYIVHQDRHISDEKEVVKESIITKKQKVVEILRKKGEIIKYLGRRIVIRDEHLYERLEKLFSEYEKILGPTTDQK